MPSLRPFKRTIASLTAFSLLLPTVVFALATGVSAPAAHVVSVAQAPVVSSVATTRVVTLQDKDVLAWIRGEVDGIPRSGAWHGTGIARMDPTPDANVRAGVAKDADPETGYVAEPLLAEAASAPAAILVGDEAARVLRKANEEASASFKLTAPSSLPAMLGTPAQDLIARIRDAGSRPQLSLPESADAPAPPEAVLAARKPAIGSAPAARAWVLVVFGAGAAELPRLPAPSEGAAVPWLPVRAGLWLDALLALAGASALELARRGFRARHVQLVFLKREQRE